ncbi:succinate dehydrogenase cytochrome b subunit [Kitasatospora sp. NBC_01287]|uniref:succinate dehydrogenase cytochrome b subunit n=1 Tax=Kitasatospora sp. NBC_01287 TaxID=2903573 RepID=UPI0022554C02|nr:succinate dehydrogenase cytochrome b subunit [Kitasatospora sp. NBC_01287]MCX4745506.1 succinate dehydrogenase cytochrome b subunit [Kitasatospora sp. NBC_01287]
MAVTTGTRPRGAARRPSASGPLAALWGSTVGKKAAMAVSGLAMLGYLVLHMIGNLKIFFGAGELNGYAAWLRTIGQPFLGHAWFLWIARVALVAAVVVHGVAAYQLSRRDLAARPTGYRHTRPRQTYATRTMRWGGVILALFIVWHILDLTTLTVNPVADPGHPYQNIVGAFHTWYDGGIYCVAMLALGLHVRHGFWSAAQTLGVNSARRDKALKLTANLLALVLTAGFLSVPIAVMTGVVR